MSAIPDSLTLRFASLEEMPSIAQLIVRSKQSWSLSDEPVDEIIGELVLDKDAVLSGRVIVATEASRPVGICAWSSTGPDSVAELTHLLVDPKRARASIASALIKAAVKQAIWEGADEFRIEDSQS